MKKSKWNECGSKGWKRKSSYFVGADCCAVPPFFSFCWTEFFVVVVFLDYSWTGLSVTSVGNQQSLVENCNGNNMYSVPNPFCSAFPVASSQSLHSNSGISTGGGGGSGGGGGGMSSAAEMMSTFAEPESWRGNSLAHLRRKALEHHAAATMGHAATMSTFRWIPPPHSFFFTVFHFRKKIIIIYTLTLHWDHWPMKDTFPAMEFFPMEFSPMEFSPMVFFTNFFHMIFFCGLPIFQHRLVSVVCSETHQFNMHCIDIIVKHFVFTFLWFSRPLLLVFYTPWFILHK